MKLLMKQRVFSWTDTYDVYDEAGNKKYFVKAELFRLVLWMPFPVRLLMLLLLKLWLRI